MSAPEKNIIKINIGPPLKETLEILSPDSEESQIDKLAVKYREYFSKYGIYEMNFYPGIERFIRYNATKYTFGIVSSKPEPFLIKILEKNNLINSFEYVSGVSLGFNNKPKKERLAELLKSKKINKMDCLFIGDRSEDAESARYAGVQFLGVTYGFGKQNELAGYNCVNDVAMLEEFIVDWAKQ